MPKVGYVAIVGRPNAGKSTLLNAIIGERVSAISPRPQTTQRSVPGIYTDKDASLQIIFLDTPGIHNHSGEQYGSQKTHDINERINSQAFASLRDADVVLRLVDPTRPPGEEDARIDEILSTLDIPVIRVETKQDLPKGYPGKNVDISVDSMSKNGFDALIQKLAAYLPEGPYLYDEDFYTDQPMYFRIAEVIREILFQELGEEIPYASYVEVGEVEDRPTSPLAGELLKIQAYVNVESDSQKTILIGKGGQKIQDIGTKSRLILEEVFGKRVFLALRVKVDKNWRKNEKVLDKLFPKK